MSGPNPIELLSRRHDGASRCALTPEDATAHAVKSGDLAGLAACVDSWHRALLTRALTAQGWMTACALEAWFYDEWRHDEDHETSGYDRGLPEGFASQVCSVATLPAPAELAADILGEL